MTLLQFWPTRFDDSDRVMRDLSKMPESTWRERGEKSALALFHSAAERVPAYRAFLAEHGINHKRIKTIEAFASVPAISKVNYLRKYPLHDLMWDGKIGGASMISRSSGSSGKPFYWPSNIAQRQEVGDFYDIVFSAMFNMRKKRTLVIIAYGMGSWVAGTTTLLSSMRFMNKYDCTFITPGVHKQEIIDICRDIGHEYEQIVICGYPPLMKEIVDLGVQEGLDWKKFHPKLIFGAEAFSEEFRDYMLEQVGSENPLLDSMNTIGSADAMVIGHETPLSIALRRKIHANQEAHDAILGHGRMPTLAQYYPWQKHLETVDGELHLTSNGSIPLIRYNIQDTAKLFTYSEMNAYLQQYCNSSVAEALPEDLRESFNWQLPFIQLYGKSTNAMKFYGAILYPENVKAALEKPAIAHSFSGKFRMEKYNDARQDQRLRIFVELAPGVDMESVPVKALQEQIVETVCSLNSEFKSSYIDVGRKMTPAIKLVRYGKFGLEPTQNKHKYVK